MKYYWHFLLWIILLANSFFSLSAQDYEPLMPEEDSLVHTYFNQGDLLNGSIAVDRAIAKARAIGNDSLVTYYLYRKSYLKILEGEEDEAKTALLKAEQIVLEKLGKEHFNYGYILVGYGSLYWELGDYEKAIVYGHKAADFRKELAGADSDLYASDLSDLGEFYGDLGMLDSAEFYLQKAIRILENVVGEYDYDYGLAVSRLASVYEDLGDYSEAEVYYLKSKAIEEVLVGKNSMDYATSLNALANLYEEMGRYEEMEPLYLEALAILKKIGLEQNDYYGSCLGNLANLYSYMGRNEEALALYKESIAIEKSVRGTKNMDYIINLANLADFYEGIGAYEEGEKVIKEALAIEAELNLPAGDRAKIHLLESWADIHVGLEKWDEAEKLYLEALKFAQKIWAEDHPVYTAFLWSISNFYLSKGDLDKSEFYCLEGFKSASPDINAQVDVEKLDKVIFNDHRAFLLLLRNLIEITYARYVENNAMEELERCFMLCQKGMLINERARHQILNAGNKLEVLELNEVFVNYGLHIAKLLGREEALLKAFQFADQNKSIVLADALKSNRARTLGDLPPELAQKEQELQDELDDLKRQIIEARHQKEKDQLFSKFNKVNGEMDVFIKSIKDDYPRYHQLKYEHTNVTTKDIQEYLEEERLFLEYFIADTITYVFAISKEKVKVYPLTIAMDDLSNYIQKFRKSLTDYRWIQRFPKESIALYKETGYWLYQQLLEKPLADFEAKNLVIVTDGALGHLPFEAFLVEYTQGSYESMHYLLQDYNVSYSYSATLWKENQETKTLKNNGEMLACGATYEALDKDVAQLRPLYLYKWRERLQGTPAAIDEVSFLEQFFEGTFFKGMAANERSFKENASTYSIIHLAMHGLLNTEYPILSSLVFTENSDTTEDNFLQAYEISKMELNASLVVLSACETGYGKFQDGEGVMSLARSFMYAGTPSLVVSLWQVNDGSTALIMKAFYAYLAQGLAKDAALRQAKLDYVQWADGVLKHPAFWSPFIQLGDNRPITLVTKTDYRIYYGIGLVVLGLLLVFFFKGKKRKEVL